MICRQHANSSCAYHRRGQLLSLLRQPECPVQGDGSAQLLALLYECVDRWTPNGENPDYLIVGRNAIALRRSADGDVIHVWHAPWLVGDHVVRVVLPVPAKSEPHSVPKSRSCYSQVLEEREPRLMRQHCREMRRLSVSCRELPR